MTEKLSIKNKDVWVTVDPHVQALTGEVKEEYFTASYYATEPTAGNSGIIFEKDGVPKLFASPVEAIEYASEKLLGLL